MLIERALAAPDDVSYLGSVRELQLLNSQAVFQAASDLLRSEDRVGRILGADVIGQLGFEQGRPFLEAALPLLLNVSRADREPGVVEAVVRALGTQEDVRALPGILSHVAHDDGAVREAVASALGPGAGVPADIVETKIVPILALLVRDAEPNVRDWAVFSLAHHEIDGEHVRALLLDRVDDHDERVRGEAIRGLARRHDGRVEKVLIANIDSAPTAGELEYLILDAVELMASDALLGPLLGLRNRTAAPDGLDVTIDHCDPERRRARVDVLARLIDALAEAGVTDAVLTESLFDPSSVGDVQLTIGGRGCYDVVALLARAGGSIDVAAQCVRNNASAEA